MPALPARGACWGGEGSRRDRRKYARRVPRGVSDTRLTIAGIGLVFAGFIVLGVFGGQYAGPSIEAEQFGDCHLYSDDAPPVKVPCEDAVGSQTAFFALVVGLIAAGIAALALGVRGRWDQKVRPEDMVGPGGGGGEAEGGAGGGAGRGPGGA